MALAQRVGRDPSVSADIEMNQRLPTVGMVVRLAAGLGVSVGWLAYGIGSPHPEETPATTEGMSARIKTARMEQGFTKAGLARLADLSATALANIEKGAQTGVDVLEALAMALEVSPAWLAFGVEPQLLPARRSARATAEPAHAAE